MSVNYLENFKWIESWLTDSNDDTEKLIAVCEIYTSATLEDKERYKKILSEKWFAFDLLKNDVSYAEKKWMIFQEKLDDKIRRIINKKDARTLDNFPIEVLKKLQKAGWMGKDSCSGIINHCIKHGMASNYGKSFFEMYFNEWGGRWDTPIRIEQTKMASGVEYALSGFELGEEYKNKKFPLSTVMLSQSVSIEKFISNFNESKKYGLLDSNIDHLFAGFVAQTSPQKKTAEWLLETLCKVVNKTSLDKMKKALTKNGRLGVAVSCGIIEKLELNCLLNEVKVDSTEVKKRRISV
jgi:hypothetical protein